MLFKYSVSLLIFCLVSLSITESGVLRSPTIIVLLSISLFQFCQILPHIFRSSYVWCIIFIIVKSFWSTDPFILIQCPFLFRVIVFVLKPILSDISIATSALFCLPFAWNFFFPSFHFQPMCLICNFPSF